MPIVRFRSGGVSLELSGSEAFVLRQLQLLSPCLGEVDASLLETNGETPVAVHEEPPAPVAEPEPEIEAVPANGGADGFLDFVRRNPPRGRDTQSDAALLFAYYLQQEEGMSALRLGDLLRCCIRAGVDTRNFNRAIGTLSRRGLLESRPGPSYRLSAQGVAAVENRA